MSTCTHYEQIRGVTPKSPDGCEECLKMGDEWVHLRLSGNLRPRRTAHDSSPNKHATAHFHQTKHAIIKSFEPGEEWGYCYVDQIFFESL